MIIVPLSGSILQAVTCQILSSAENPSVAISDKDVFEFREYHSDDDNNDDDNNDDEDNDDYYVL